jgi:hypothetical protein
MVRFQQDIQGAELADPAGEVPRRHGQMPRHDAHGIGGCRGVRLPASSDPRPDVLAQDPHVGFD